MSDIFKLLKTQSEQLGNLNTKVDAIEAEVRKVESIELEVRNIRVIVTALKEENNVLRTELKKKDKQLEDMNEKVNSVETRLNNLEQHHRGWGARVLNIPLTSDEEQQPDIVINRVFNLAIKPVLEGAARAGKLHAVPAAEQVLELAHVLPGKPGMPKPIIMRFINRNLRDLVFRLKRDFAEREEPASARGETAGSDTKVGRFRYPLFDDLTKANLAKMRAIRQDERVLACWTVGGQIRFKLKDSEGVRKVTSIMDPIDKILK